MAELLAYLARELVDEPDAVRVDTEEREGMLVLVLSLPDSVRLLLAEMSRVDTRIQTLLLGFAEPSP